MKYITYLVMLLVLLLAAPVVWAGQVGHTVDMPEYLTANVSVHSPIVAAHCRDVGHSHNLFIYKKTNVDYTETIALPNGDGIIAWIGTGLDNHKEAAVLTGKAEFSRWQSANEKTYIIESTHVLAGGIV
ncbi:hypothetical protein KAR91_12400 [Candidatus Pacearchaeota archaeon]|nr:hypothetical protein [Candidatus Pacearchaeota archaeon]